MIKKIACLLVAVFALAPVFSQTYSTKFGKISEEELSMSVYPADSTASAVVLHDIGESLMNYNTSLSKFQLRIKRQTRIKILNKDGFDWANIEIPLFHDGGTRETLSDVKAYTFNNVNGKVEKVKVNKKDFFYETINENKRVCKFAMPQVKEGSVIEYEYEITSDFIYNFQPWSFQFSIPVLYTEYNIRYPEYFTYNYHLSGYEMIEVKNSESTQQILFRGFDRAANGLSRAYNETLSYSQTEKRFTGSNIPALRSEAYVDNINNYITKVSFELAQTKFPNELAKQHTSSWNKIVEDFLEYSDFGGQIKGGNYLEDDLLSKISSYTDPKERLIATFDFVKGRVKWNGKYRVLSDSGVRSAFKDGIGSSADVNLNLIVALRKAGFDAFPVILSTRSNGLILDWKKTKTDFNHVIALVSVDGVDFVLDATSVLGGVEVLPMECLNGQGLIVDEKRKGWVSLSPRSISKKISYAELEIDGVALKGKLNTNYSDNYALSYKENNPALDCESIQKKLSEQYSNATIDSLILNVESGINPLLKLKYNYVLEGAVATTPSLIYISPFVGIGLSSNPLKLNDRKFPVNFGFPFEDSFIIKFRIPDGYQVESIPESINMALPEGKGRYILSASTVGGTIVLVCKMQLNRDMYIPSDYLILKQFFEQIVSKSNEKIVLKKV